MTVGILKKSQYKEIIEAYKIKTTEDAQAAVKDLFKEILQTTLEAELETTLGYAKYDQRNKETTNSRNGTYSKQVQSTFGNINLEIPRDRDGEHEPLIVKKGEQDVSSLQARIVSMYGGGTGMSTRDIEAHMQDIYGVQMSAEMISNITDRILPKIREWQARQLHKIYAILYMDAIHFNVRQDGKTIKKAIYIAMAIDCEGMKDVLGIWVNGTGNESSKYWLNVLTELKNRGVQDILISCVDGLSGFEEAIHTVYPATEIQRCVVHQIRYACKFVNYKDRKEFCADMKKIYTASTEEAGLEALLLLDKKWGRKYAYAIKSWENNWVNESHVF